MSEARDYCFLSDFDGDGSIVNRANEVVWRFRTTGLKYRAAEQTSGSPVFAFCDPEERELLTIMRPRRLPLARFVLIEDGLPVGTIRQRSILFNRYTIESDSGWRCVLHMPLFTTSFRAATEVGAEVRIAVRTLREWYVRITEGFDSVHLMASLAFLTRKRIQCT